MRLNAYIAKAGFCARRKADVYIKGGEVKVSDNVVVEPWYVIKDGDKITINGKALAAEKEVYLVVSKPKGVTATLEDKFAARKITELIPRKYGRLYPVGRLDKDSRGLIILTNDGEFCYRLTHPKFEIEKEYVVLVEGLPADLKLADIKKGVWDDGDVLKVKSCNVIGTDNGKTELSLIICEGKKRHIRRIFKHIDVKILDLKRVRVGGLKLGGMRDGTFKVMKKAEIYALALKS